VNTWDVRGFAVDHHIALLPRHFPSLLPSLAVFPSLHFTMGSVFSSMSSSDNGEQASGGKTSTTRDMIRKEVDSHDVVVWSKSWCGYCRSTIRVFESMQPLLPFTLSVRQLDGMPDGGRAAQDELERMTSQRTVPNAFVKGSFVGGNDAVQSLYRSGQLERMMKAEQQS